MDFKTLADQIKILDERRHELGMSALEILRRDDVECAQELEDVFESAAPIWLTEKTRVFRGQCAIELLANDQRTAVMRALANIKYGLCA
jgi:hypothetical protein